jgi:DNA modification methylase
MVRDILKVFPNAEIVLDPFIGSGSTAIACKQLERMYIGFEIQKEYVQFARNRLRKVKKLKNLKLDNFIEE